MRLLLILFSLLPLCLPAQSTRQIRNLQSQQSKLKKEIAEGEKELRSNRKTVAAQLNDLNLINSQITRQTAYVKDIHGEVSRLSGQLTRLDGEIRRLERDLAECKRHYKRAVLYMQRQKALSTDWQFIFAARDFRQMYRRMRYVQEFTKYQRAQGRDIQRKEESVKAKRAEVLATKQQKDRLLAEGRAEQAKLEGQQKERQGMVEKLSLKQNELQRTIAGQKKKAASLDKKIDQLIQAEIAAAERRRKAAEEKRRREEAERRAREKKERQRREAAARRKGGSKATGTKKDKKSGTRSRNEEKAAEAPRYHAETNADRALSNSFSANRGRLPMPITGSYFISTRFGKYNVDGLKGVRLDSKGINVTGKAGAQARAVFKGEVTAVFAYGGMWNVIVRHGSYMTVYCNLASCSVRQGQRVDTRQALGPVARDAAGNCTLHFQLRKETQKLNPEGWLAK